MQDFWGRLRSLHIDWAAMEPQLQPSGAATLLERLRKVRHLDISCLEVVCATAALRLHRGIGNVLDDAAGHAADAGICAHL